MIDSEAPKQAPAPATPPVHAPTAPAAPHDEHGFDPNDPAYAAKPASTHAVLAAATVFVIALGALFVLGFVPMKRHQQDLLAETDGSTQPQVVVSVAHPRRSAETRELSLPATVRPYFDTVIYARTNGYIRRWLVDIGDRVKVGQLLAEIDVPELDQQIDQARASLNQLKARLALAEAQVTLAESTLKRYEAAAPGGGITAQELDEKRAGVEVQRATVEAARSDVEAGAANVRRLVQLKDFATVSAPFAGTITSRSIEVGALVTAGNGKGQELFHLVQTNPVRVYVNVPQISAPYMADGTPAELVVREHPGQKFVGKVVRTTRAIDDATRTLLADVEVPNEDGLLLPGMYTRVHFRVAQPGQTVFVPQSALVVTADGTQVLTVGEGDHLHYQKVVVDTDYGSEVALSSGVDETDRVVTNPGEKLLEGIVVQVKEAEAPKPAAK
jgi:RND family efflux transporter MFP subunit